MTTYSQIKDALDKADAKVVPSTDRSLLYVWTKLHAEILQAIPEAKVLHPDEDLSSFSPPTTEGLINQVGISTADLDEDDPDSLQSTNKAYQASKRKTPEPSHSAFPSLPGVRKAEVELAPDFYAAPTKPKHVDITPEEPSILDRPVKVDPRVADASLPTLSKATAEPIFAADGDEDLGFDRWSDYRSGLSSRSVYITEPADPFAGMPERIVAVPWNYNNSLTLANLGAGSISSMMNPEEYFWPGKLRPFDHQYQIAAFLSIHPRSFCLADMGTGKTLATAHAINYLHKIGVIKKILIVCPLSVMRDAWQVTINELGSDLRCDILYALNKHKRVEMLRNSTAQIHIVNPDGVEVLLQDLREQKYDLIVIDELTTYKTPSTSRWKHLNSLTLEAKYVWGITGTPVPNSPLESYGQIKIVSPDNLKGIGLSTFKGIINYALNRRFLNSTAHSKEEFNNVDTSLEIVFKYFNPAIRIKKEDCVKLPPLISSYLYCELSPQQKAMIQQLRDNGIVQLRSGGNISPRNGAATILKIIQACCGAIYDQSREIIPLNSKSRINETIRLIAEAKAERTATNKGKTLVFVPFKSALDILFEELKKHFKVAKINSEVSEKARAQIFHMLQETDELDVIVAIPTTMSHGITATAASLIIWYAPVHSCETYIQACNRINRVGQTQKMHIVHLYGSEIESKIFRSLQEKQLNNKRLLDFYKAFIEGK